MRFIGMGLHLSTALLTTFKLVGALDWPWLWVIAPSLCAFGLALLMLAFAGIALLIHKWLMRDPSYRLQNAFENFERALRRSRS